MCFSLRCEKADDDLLKFVIPSAGFNSGPKILTAFSRVYTLTRGCFFFSDAEGARVGELVGIFRKDDRRVGTFRGARRLFV